MAFDADVNSVFITPFTNPVWLEYQFTEPKEIVKYSITPKAEGSPDGSIAQSGKDWTFQYYDGASWITVHTVIGEPAWTLGTAKTFEYGVSGKVALDQVVIEVLDSGTPQVALDQCVIEVLYLLVPPTVFMFAM